MRELTLACGGQHLCGVSLLGRAVAGFIHLSRDCTVHEIILACTGRYLRRDLLLEYAVANVNCIPCDCTVHELGGS